jgi:hypothetical protein
MISSLYVIQEIEFHGYDFHNAKDRDSERNLERDT